MADSHFNQSRSLHLLITIFGFFESNNQTAIQEHAQIAKIQAGYLKNNIKHYLGSAYHLSLSI
jgi:hypothetical protein